MIKYLMILWVAAVALFFGANVTTPVSQMFGRVADSLVIPHAFGLNR